MDKAERKRLTSKVDYWKKKFEESREVNDVLRSELKDRTAEADENKSYATECVADRDKAQRKTAEVIEERVRFETELRKAEETIGEKNAKIDELIKENNALQDGSKGAFLEVKDESEFGKALAGMLDKVKKRPRRTIAVDIITACADAKVEFPTSMTKEETRQVINILTEALK